MGLVLSSQDVARFTTLQEALLAPLQYETVDAWCATVLRQAEVLFGADRSAMFVPVGNQIHYVSESVDPRSLQAFEEGIREQQPGALRFSETLVDQAWNARRAKGIEVWSIPILERLLGRPMNQIQMYHEAVKPAGLTHSAVASTALPTGEAFFGVSHSRAADASFNEPERLQLMTMLLPAFKAGVHAVVRLDEHRAELIRATDTLGQALLLSDGNGSELFRSMRLEEVLAAEPERDDLLTEIRLAARAVARLQRAQGPREPGPAGMCEVMTARARYALRASSLGPGVVTYRPVVLLLVERLTPELPSITRLMERYSLTGREAEVAVLLARGLSNREIGLRLRLSPHTVRHHAEWVFSKLGVHSRKALGLKLLGGDTR